MTYPLRRIVPSATCLIIAWALLASGCSQRTNDVWTPKPLVVWEDLCTQPIPQTINTYRMINAQPTRGLFPASMSVTRIGIDDEDHHKPGVRVRLVADPRNEFLQWNTALNHQLAISEVFPVRDYDLGGRPITLNLLFDASVALNAKLGLIYGVNELSEDRTEILGVIYDMQHDRPLVAIHSEATTALVDDRNAKPPPVWKTNASALARTRFERLLHAGIRDLILHDEPTPVAVPAGWPPSKQPQPAVWPPVRPERGP